ncbi:MAG: spermidine/putrescine ABC transporter substrate-binding protein [Peptostreptococcaceae bacterium]|nr:spermidine/putrescine ABC transporter substrate-binding protein [Peptostreptococcaceae bacterium]
MKKVLAVMMLFVMLMVVGCSGDETAKATLNVYNWGDYIDEEVIREFEKEFNVKVNYEIYANNEEMLAKIKAGGTAYDVIFPSEYMIEYMIASDMLNELDYSKLPNYSNIDDRFKNLEYDPENKHSVPYMWGTMGIVYNTKIVTEPVTSWDMLWNEKYAGKILMLDSSRDSLVPAQKKLGFSINTKNLDELNAARDELIKQKPLVRAYEVDAYKEQMIVGEGAMALTWSGDAYLLISENPDLAFAVPEEGTNLWFDAIAIPKVSKNVDLAHEFVNFMMKPEIAARNSDYLKFSSPNAAAVPLLPEEDAKNENLYPQGDIMSLGEVFLDLGEFTVEYDRAWTEIKAS